MFGAQSSVFGICRQWPCQPASLVLVCKFSSIIIIDFFRNLLFLHLKNVDKYSHSLTESANLLHRCLQDNMKYERRSNDAIRRLSADVPQLTQLTNNTVLSNRTRILCSRNISFAKTTFDGIIPIAIDRSAIVIDTVKKH